DPQRRYSSAKELAKDLGRWLVGEPIHARPVGQLENAVKWVKRRPAVAALYSAIAALIALAIGSAIFYQREQIIQQLAREAADRQARAAATVDALQTA